MNINRSMSTREKHFANKFNNAKLGFKYHNGYINSDSSMFIKCDKCGQLLERSGGFLRKGIRGERNIACSQCEGRVMTNALKVAIEKECNLCKEVFQTHSHSQAYCSDECYRKHRNQKIENRRRIRQYQLIDCKSYDSSISLKALIAKDKNKCHICGGICDDSDYILDDDNSFIVGAKYPSIDHVVPVSKDGTHTWDNIKLAHHYCNTIKSNNEIYKEGNGQLKLII